MPQRPDHLAQKIRVDRPVGVARDDTYDTAHEMVHMPCRLLRTGSDECLQEATMKGISPTTRTMLRSRQGSVRDDVARRLGRTILVLSTSIVALACGPAIPEGLVDDLRADYAAQAADAEARGSTTVVGLDGWLFFGPELRHVSVGAFWGERARNTTRARRPDAADPLPAILDFHRQLDALGVELLVVPVPPKSVIYPEKVAAAPEIPMPAPRLDRDHQAFYALLRDDGVDLLDLTDRFLDDRYHPEGALYCRQDTHWSGVGCVIAAQEIAAAVRGRPWYAELDTRRYPARWHTTTINGDLLRDLVEPRPREELRLRAIASDGESGPGPVATASDSPIVLLGDSHALVFHAGGDMHAVGAGLADQLAFELGFPMDLVAVRGSGATAARLNLLRRAQSDPDYWQRKRLVIWCFAAREFTESDGWRAVPIAP